MAFSHHASFVADFTDLLDRLRAAGYGVGMGELRKIEALYAALADCDVPPNLTQMQDMLAAVLCRSPEQQADFARHFQAWLDVQVTPDVDVVAVTPVVADSVVSAPYWWRWLGMGGGCWFVCWLWVG